MHTSIPMELPIEFIDITQINPLISKCKIKVCYVSDEPNRNRSIITKEVAKDMANSLPGSPIVGYYSEEKQDFEEHNRIIDISNGEFKIKDTTRPYGFVDLGAKAWFQKFLDDGIEHEYLMTEGHLWTGQYPEAQRIIDKGNNQSMELDESTLNAYWTEDVRSNFKFFIINEAIISKLCILGEDVEPCFEGATISKFSLGDDFKEQLYSMMEQIKELLEKEGGQPVTEETKITEVEEVVEPEVIEKEEEVVVEPAAPAPEAEVVEDLTPEEEETPAEEVVEVEAPAAEPEEEEICPEEDKVEKYNLDEIQEYVDLKVEFDTLQINYNSLSTELENLKVEYSKLVEFKNSIDREKKEAMIESFYMLSDEDKKDVKDNIDSYSLDDIEAKLSIICVRNKVSFNLEEEPIPSNYSYNIYSEDNGVVPAWVKSLKTVAKELK